MDQDLEMNINNNLNFVWIYLICHICKKILVKPKTLTCQHSFCFHCIEKAFGKLASGCLFCPVCEETQFAWNAKDITNSSELIYGLLEIYETIRKTKCKTLKLVANNIFVSFLEYLIVTKGQIEI